MLQRIQSIYLLLAALALAALFIFPLMHDVYVNGALQTIKITGVYQDVNGQLTNILPFNGLTIATALVILVPLIIIFLYKNRTLQSALCYSAILMLIGYSYWASHCAKWAIGNANISLSNYGVGIGLISLSIIFIILAQKAIKRDDKLVKSADRLR
jgi:hypothetical protein